MKSMNNPVIWTDADLDGAGSYTLFKWINDQEYELHTTTAKSFQQDMSNWINANDNNIKREIYILDLDVSDSIALIDLPNITVYDHHPAHVNSKEKYRNANVILEECTSCVKLIFKDFHKKYPEQVLKLTTAQTTLIAFVNDYDCYALKYKQSYILNVIYWNLFGNRVAEFYNQFKDGFTGFNAKHIAMFDIHEKRLKQIISELEYNRKNIPIQGEKRKVVCALADYAINDVADHLIKNKNAEIAIVVNLKSGTVSFRKLKNCSVHLGKLASALCDGGGHEYAAGGKVCDKFLDFCKFF